MQIGQAFIFRFFIQIASDCESHLNNDQMQLPISFVSDANIIAMHRLLYTHQEKIGNTSDFVFVNAIYSNIICIFRRLSIK